MIPMTTSRESRELTAGRRSALRRRLTALLLVVGALATGCTATVRPARVHPHKAVAVKIKAGHTHTVRCGHYRHGQTWYFVKAHVHGRACGHAKVRGVWVLR